MPRKSRIIFPGIPHHVVQRGNRGECVFFSDEDRIFYLKLLKHYTKKHQVAVLAYCLMPNHVHLILVPPNPESLHRSLKPLHMRHAQRINKLQTWSGHLWQDRYFSSPLDEHYLQTAIRYIERNPVRAEITKTPWEYRWSSAPIRCRRTPNHILSEESRWRAIFKNVKDWGSWLSEEVSARDRDVLRKNLNRNLPCGSEVFIKTLEQLTNRTLRVRPRGRPPKEKLASLF